MWEFLQAYGYWMVFGLFIVFMLRMHAGGGCGMGHGQHGDRGTPKPVDADADRTVSPAAPTSRVSGHH